MTTCGTCDWFLRDASTKPTGRCYHQPPIVLVIKGDVVTERPKVFADDRGCALHIPVKVP